MTIGEKRENAAGVIKILRRIDKKWSKCKGTMSENEKMTCFLREDVI